MTTARDLMSSPAEFVRDSASLREVAVKLALQDIGFMPVCDQDGHLAGVVTDRDVVVRGIAAGYDPARTPVGVLVGQAPVVLVDAGSDVRAVAALMRHHRIRRLPVLDGDAVVGVISQGDLTGHLPARDLAELLAAVSSPALHPVDLAQAVPA